MTLEFIECKQYIACAGVRGTFFHGHDGGEGLAALPDRGIIFHFHDGADGAAPSRAPSPGHDGGEGSRRPTAMACFYTGTTARTEPRPPARLPPGTTAVKGLAALPNRGAHFPGHDGGEGSRRPTGRWHNFSRARRRGRSRVLPCAFSRASCPSRRSALPSLLSLFSLPSLSLSSLKSLLSQPQRPPSRRARRRRGSRRPTGRWHNFSRARRRGRSRALPRAFPRASSLPFYPSYSCHPYLSPP